MEMRSQALSRSDRAGLRLPDERPGRGARRKTVRAGIVLRGHDFCWAILSAMSTALGLLVACALGIALSFTAYVAASTLCARLDTLTRWAATAVALAGLCTAIFHLLAWEHAFTQVPVLALALAVSAAATIGSGGFAAASAGLRRDRRFARRFAARARQSPYRWIAVALLLAPLPAVARAIVLPPLGWDALTYHSVKAAMWVQHGGGEVMKGPGPWAYYANMPAGAEVLQAWTMLPTSSDVFTTSLDVLEWIAVGLGVILLARRIGAKEPLPSIAAAFVLSIPPVRLMLGSAYSEPFLLSMLFIGLALLLSADRSSGALVARRPRARPVRVRQGVDPPGDERGPSHRAWTLDDTGSRQVGGTGSAARVRDADRALVRGERRNDGPSPFTLRCPHWTAGARRSAAGVPLVHRPRALRPRSTGRRSCGF